jgi:hypothetical protein
MAARGGMMRSPDIARGIASIPVSQFKQSNFAGGGIVAFADNEGETVGQAASRERGEGESYLDYFKRRASESLQGPFFSERGTMQYPKMYQSMSERTARETAAADAERKNQNLPQASYSNEGRAYRSDAPGPRVTPSPLVIPQDQNKQASATTSGQIEKPPAAPTAPPRPTIADRLGSAVPTEEETQAAIDRQRKLMEAYGISQDPYADVRKRYEAIEKRREERRAEEPSDRLMATLAAFSKAAPEKGLGYQLGVASEARAALSKEQNILRDKQDTEMAALYNSMAKEEDARKRGDMKAVELELKNQREHRAKIVDLEQKQEQVDAQMLNARANMVQAQRGPQAPAEIQLVEKIARDKGISFTEAYEYLQSAKGMEGLKRQADKEWNESMALRMEWEKKGGYPAYMASKGIAVGGGAAPAPGSRPAPKKGDVVQGYRFKGGDPSKQENWEKV